MYLTEEQINGLVACWDDMLSAPDDHPNVRHPSVQSHVTSGIKHGIKLCREQLLLSAKINVKH